MKNENYQKRVKNKTEEVEYSFGIQKFDNAEDAFKMMDTAFGDENSNEAYHNIYIGNESFTCKLFNQVLMFYYMYKKGAMPEGQYKAGLMLDGTITDEFLSFNFLIYNKKNNCFYASLMEDWEDDKAVLSKRQLDIYLEIWEAYNISENIKRILEVLEEGVEKDFGDRELDETFFDLARNKWFGENNVEQTTNEYGYQTVNLVNDKGEEETRYVHELVAEAFVPNPNNLPYVRHKDGNIQNNKADNLEWTDVKPEYIK